MTKLKTTANRLQMALTVRGRYITISTRQFYSEQFEKMCTKYILQERQVIQGEKKNVTLFKTMSMIDVVTFLANELNGGG